MLDERIDSLAPALDDSAHAWHHTDEQLVQTILDGFPQGSGRMVAWKMYVTGGKRMIAILAEWGPCANLRSIVTASGRAFPVKQRRSTWGAWLLILVFFQTQGLTLLPVVPVPGDGGAMTDGMSRAAGQDDPSSLSTTMNPVCPHTQHAIGHCGACAQCGVVMVAALAAVASAHPAVYDAQSDPPFYSHATLPLGHPPQPLA